MTDKKAFSCFVVGADTLLQECSRILLEAGHSVRGIVTSTPRIASWAEERGLTVISDRGDWGAALRTEPFDYLFAITHLAMIPEEILGLPQRRAINFHDGPLPRYAGLNSPVWALMREEPQYGISWHVMEAGPDTGDVLKQVVFEVAPEETSLTLNTKCFEAGIAGFTELVEELATGGEQPSVQDLSQRSYFGKRDRPPALCLLDWAQPARSLEAMVRAFDFGPYPNPFATAKIRHQDAILAVTGAEPTVGPPGTPGTVSAVEDDAVVVQTGEGALALTGLATLEGTPLNPEEALKHLGIAVGATLETYGVESADSLTEAYQEVVRREDFWVRRLRNLSPLEAPLASAVADPGPASAGFVDLPLSGAYPPAEVIVAGFLGYLARQSQKQRFDVGFSHPKLREFVKGRESWLASEVPLRLSLEWDQSTDGWIAAVAEGLQKTAARATYGRDVWSRFPDLQERFGDAAGGSLPVSVVLGDGGEAADAAPAVLSLVVGESGTRLRFQPGRLSAIDAERIAAGVSTFTARLQSDRSSEFGRISLLTEAEQEMIARFNQTQVDAQAVRCVHEVIADQAAKAAERTAIVFEGEELTYGQLEERANQLAHHLVELGVGPDVMAGLYLERSADLVVAILAVHKAGGAYVPLDPDYPTDRIAYMVEDAAVPVIVTQRSLVDRLPPHSGRVVALDSDRDAIDGRPRTAPATEVKPHHLAYVIYTSGSTGRPKGVMVEHRNALNFFAGMDPRIPHDPPGTWVAVTSLSFDISVLELLWTLSRGFRVVVYRDRTGTPQSPKKKMDFGLFYWGNDDGAGRQKYRLLLEGAKFADGHGFDSVWTPERHFHAFGGPYPNPSVTGAAVAAVTSRIQIRAGSCVVPLHHPARIAEEWAVLDNLSDGRVGLSIAAGWQPDDFILRPENAPPTNKDAMFRDAEKVRRLWRGESVEFEGAGGKKIAVVTQPRPVQPELPVWVTTAGNPATYKQAATAGANVLTHLLGQSIAEVGDKIRIYRDALEAEGRSRSSGKVTLMLHTFVGTDREAVREITREPMKDYLRSAAALIKQYAWAFPAFKRPEGASNAMDVDLQTLGDEELEAILEFAFLRYFEDSGLFGTVEDCLARIEQLRAIGVDDIACLIDYGVATDQVLEMLPHLSQVVHQANADLAGDGLTLPEQLQRYQASHLQCTPSMARMLTVQDEGRDALREVGHLMVGGEAFPPDLAQDLEGLVKESVTNMYGPTETTIWSSTWSVSQPERGVSIGTPIANTSMYVLDARGGMLPPGTPGELYIGGDGVVRGYLHRPELTAERFVPDPFAQKEGARMYRTGDLVRFRPDGTLEFLGRIDHQVKLRGYRIELGEIESVLSSHAQIRQGVVLAREDSPGDQRLVAYSIAEGSRPDDAELRDHLREKLPDYMVPAHYVFLDAFPLTPNGKIDRKALPPPEQAEPSTEVAFVAPASGLEQTIATVWQSTLGRSRVGLDDNFFDLGGHSLLIVQVHRLLREQLSQPLSITDLYRFPTVRSLTEHLGSDGSSAAVAEATDRAARRRDALGRRRRRGRA